VNSETEKEIAKLITKPCPDCAARQRLSAAIHLDESYADYPKLGYAEAVVELSAIVDKLPDQILISHEEMKCRKCGNIYFVPDC
jgi:hypothetical protein